MKPWQECTVRYVYPKLNCSSSSQKKFAEKIFKTYWEKGNQKPIFITFPLSGLQKRQGKKSIRYWVKYHFLRKSWKFLSKLSYVKNAISRKKITISKGHGCKKWGSRDPPILRSISIQMPRYSFYQDLFILASTALGPKRNKVMFFFEKKNIYCFDPQYTALHACNVATVHQRKSYFIDISGVKCDSSRQRI